ncbi:hypothetical protein HMPREF3192_00179 [Atopobium deltae]|uniref:Uncharacterized protein n=1 Tax=Atopobium deltae TaxID=1393034 RepID=A0A133XX70_9ACTN|nr:hypothetical protein HMPREF3192_00179 [Atopobium deltae]
MWGSGAQGLLDRRPSGVSGRSIRSQHVQNLCKTPAQHQHASHARGTTRYTSKV